MTRYTRISKTVEAFRLGYDPTPSWFKQQKEKEFSINDFIVNTPTGMRVAVQGDYIVREDNGNLQLIDARIFEREYIKASEH